MSTRFSGLLACFTFAVLDPHVVFAQHNKQRTITVDPTSGAADHQTIAQALGDTRIPTDPGNRFTILIYAGTYPESVALGVNKENIDLVGVDRDAVIIAPTTGNGVTITSGTETARNNSIRNLTIKTTSGHGIEIVVGASNQVPKNITIEGVTIDAAGTGKNGIAAANLQESKVADCTITTTDGQAIDLTRTTAFTAPTNNILTGLTLLPSGSAKHGIRASDVQGLQILNSTITPDDGVGIDLIKASGGAAPSKVTVDGVTITTDVVLQHAIDIESASGDITIRNSTLETRNTLAHAINVRAAGAEPALENLRVLSSQLLPSGGMGGADSNGIHIGHPVKSLLVQDVHMRFDADGLALKLLPTASGSKFLTLEGVTVRNTSVRPLIDLSGSIKARLVNCDLLDSDAPYNFVHVGTDTEIVNCNIRVDFNSKDNNNANYDSAAVYGDGISGLRIVNSRLQGLEWGLRLGNNCTDVLVSNSTLIGSHYGVVLECGDNISFESCTIVGDSANGKNRVAPAEYHGVFIDDKDSACEPGTIKFAGCTIRAASAENDLDARGVYVKAAPLAADGPVVFKDCNISARVTVTDADDSDEARAYGVIADEAGAVAMDGGSITSSDSDEREHIQYDVYNSVGGTTSTIATTGVKYSKWLGPIASALQPAPVTQRMVNVSAVSDTAILSAAALTTSEQTITTGITQPDVSRVVSVKGNAPGMTQKVFIIGKNAAGERITDVIQLNSSTRMEGVKPFKSVEKIILPAQSGPGQTVSVGSSSKLGLQYVISGSSDVLQQGRKTSAATSYTLETLGTVDPTYAWVNVGAFTNIATGDSFELAYVASR